MNLFNHYAVYVNGVDFPNKTADQDIFELTTKGCRFNKIDKKNYVIKNKADLTKKPDEEIKETIIALHEDGCKYHVLTNNCEHVATYIVYGVKACSQRGTAMAKVCPLIDKISRKYEELRSLATAHRGSVSLLFLFPFFLFQLTMDITS